MFFICIMYKHRACFCALVYRAGVNEYGLSENWFWRWSVSEIEIRRSYSSSFGWKKTDQHWGGWVIKQRLISMIISRINFHFNHTHWLLSCILRHKSMLCQWVRLKLVSVWSPPPSMLICLFFSQNWNWWLLVTYFLFTLLVAPWKFNDLGKLLFNMLEHM